MRASVLLGSPMAVARCTPGAGETCRRGVAFLPAGLAHARRARFSGQVCHRHARLIPRVAAALPPSETSRPQPAVLRASTTSHPTPGSAALALDSPTPGFDSIASALEDIAAGRLVVVLDSEDRENEGDLIGAADRMTAESCAFLVRHTSGVVCVGMPGSELDRLGLPLMVSSAENEETMYTAFTVTVDARRGVTTGISAAERAHTLRTLANPDTRAEDLRKPGHIFPLRARTGGVLRRPGHTEAGADLTRLAGCFPAGALCEVVNDDVTGTMARAPELEVFAARHGLRRVTIADLARYRLLHDELVRPAGRLPLPDADVSLFQSLLDDAVVRHALVARSSTRDKPLRVAVVDLAQGTDSSASADADCVVLLHLPQDAADGNAASTVAAALDSTRSKASAPAPTPLDQLNTAFVAHMLKAAGLTNVELADAGLAAGLRAHGLAARTC